MDICMHINLCMFVYNIVQLLMMGVCGSGFYKVRIIKLHSHLQMP